MPLKLNILVAEDDVNDQLLWDHLFAQPNLTSVYYVWSGQEVVDYLSGTGPFVKREKYPYPHVLFLDLEMPRMNGLHVLEWLEANPAVARPTIYVYTGAKGSPLRAQVEKYAVKGFLEKPLTVTQVSAIVNEGLAS